MFVRILCILCLITSSCDTVNNEKISVNDSTDIPESEIIESQPDSDKTILDEADKHDYDREFSPDNDKQSPDIDNNVNNCQGTNITIEGFIKHAVTEEPLSEIAIELVDIEKVKNKTSTQSGSDGFFSLKTEVCDFNRSSITIKVIDYDSTANGGVFNIVVKSVELTENRDSTLSNSTIQIDLIPTDGVGQPDMTCVMTKCGLAGGKCYADATCKAALDCTNNCPVDDPEKNQRCNVLCLARHNSPKFAEVSKCIEKNECFQTKDSHCPLPDESNPLAQVKLSDLEGSWYVIRGLSRAYDCWPCQKMTFAPMTDETWDYDYYYMVIPPEIDKHECEVSLNNENPGNIKVEYEAHGLTGYDDWHVLSWPDPDYMLIYYCGYTSIAKYRGGIVMSRNKNTHIPDEILQIFDNAIKKAGINMYLEMSHFCTTELGECEN